MVGTYPDPPGPRIAYDRDGCQVVLVNTSSSSISGLSQSDIEYFNNETASESPRYVINGSQYITIIFPILHDLVAITTDGFSEFGNSPATSPTWQYSTDTTNGLDGTWTNGSTCPATASPAAYRTTWTTVAYNGIKAIRFPGTNGVYNFYYKGLLLYGQPSSSTPDKLVFWHPTLNQALRVTPAYLDYGDIPRNTLVTPDRSFRLKNLSAGLTANNITVGVQALSDASSPTHVSEFTVKYDTGSFGSTATLGSLGPGQISSGLFTLRNNPGASSVMSLWTLRAYADALSWT